MAWPPPTQATNVSNATPQQDTHPDLHNAQGAAINDIRDQLLRFNDLVWAEALQQDGPSGTYDPLYWTTVRSDANNWVQANGIEIIPSAGWYLFCVQIKWDATPADAGCAVELRRNGVTKNRVDSPAIANPDSDLTWINYADGSHVFTVEGFQNSGASRYMSGELAIVRVTGA